MEPWTVVLGTYDPEREQYGDEGPGIIYGGLTGQGGVNLLGKLLGRPR